MKKIIKTSMFIIGMSLVVTSCELTGTKEINPSIIEMEATASSGNDGGGVGTPPPPPPSIVN